MLIEPSPTPTSGALHAQQRVGWQPSRFPTDRAKAERGHWMGKELMEGIGHTSSGVVLCYQHVLTDRQAARAGRSMGSPGRRR